MLPSLALLEAGRVYGVAANGHLNTNMAQLYRHADFRPLPDSPTAQKQVPLRPPHAKWGLAALL